MKAADLIRKAREAAGQSQSELARAIATAQPVISAYERGHRDPSLETLRRIIDGTGLRLDIGFTRVADDGLPRPVDDAERAARLEDVLLLADALPRPRRGDLEMPRMVSTR